MSFILCTFIAQSNIAKIVSSITTATTMTGRGCTPSQSLEDVIPVELEGPAGLTDAVAVDEGKLVAELGVTVTTVVLAPVPWMVWLDVDAPANSPLPSAPNMLNSATVAPSSSPVAWQPSISSMAHVPDHIGVAKAKYDMLPTYGCTISLVAASYCEDTVIAENETVFGFNPLLFEDVVFELDVSL